MARRVKLPRRIAGVRMPRAVRNGPIVDFLGSSRGQILLVGVLAVVVGAYAIRKSDPDSAVGQFVRSPLSGMKNVGRSAPRQANGAAAMRLAHALFEGVRAFRRALSDDDAAYGAGRLFEDPELAPGGETTTSH